MHVGPVLVWLLATVVSIAVAAAAILQVGREVVLDSPIDERLAEVAAPGDDEVAPTGDGVEEDAPPGTGDDGAAADDGDVPADTTDEDPTEGDDPTEADDPTETDAATDGDDPGDGDAAAPQPVTNTYDSIGGSAAITVTGSTVELAWATPRAGFRVDVERAVDGHELRVEFRSDDHRSRIKVSVEHGELREDIDEDDRR